jgi:hypothetical protein
VWKDFTTKLKQMESSNGLVPTKTKNRMNGLNRYVFVTIVTYWCFEECIVEQGGIHVGEIKEVSFDNERRWYQENRGEVRHFSFIDLSI